MLRKTPRLIQSNLARQELIEEERNKANPTVNSQPKGISKHYSHNLCHWGKKQLEMTEKMHFNFLSKSRGESKAAFGQSYNECLGLTQSFSCTSGGSRSSCADAGVTVGRVISPNKCNTSSMHGSGKQRNNSPSTAMTPLVNNKNKRNLIGKNGKQKHPDLPGIFILINQNNWTRVAARAKKYPKECKISGYVKKPNPAYSTQNGDSRAADGTDSFASLMTAASNDSAQGNLSPSSRSTRTGQTKSSTHVKCKALHHACTQLRKVHTHIRKCIIEALSETNPCELDQCFGNGESNLNLYGTQSFTNSLSSFDSSEDGSYTNNTDGHTQVQHQHVQEWDDPWIEACKAILAIIQANPAAAGQRESRHGCLPIHLASFAMCPPPTLESVGYGRRAHDTKRSSQPRVIETLPPPRPLMPSRCRSSSSAASSVTSLDGFSAVMDSENHVYGGKGKNKANTPKSQSKIFDDGAMEELERKLRSSPKGGLSKKDEAAMLESARVLSLESRPPPLSSFMDRGTSIDSTLSTCSNSVISATSTVASTVLPYVTPKAKLFDLKKYIANAQRREEYSSKVINALLDAFPKGVKVDSEGGRLPLHTAVAGRATAKVIQTLVRANPHASRHRNNENSLPLHLAAMFGVSEEEVATILLKVYPDASVGKNRWERTPLEEALLMAGENGRPKQIQLLQILRRPTHYWSCDFIQPPKNEFFQENGVSNMNIEALLKGEGGAQPHRRPKAMNINYDVVTDLVTLVKARQWDVIVDRIDSLSVQTSRFLQTSVRAGYAAKVSALYIACEQQPTYEALDALVTACPGTTSWRKQPGGQLPLHAACTWGASASVIGFLLAASPDSTRQRDSLGNLPLHCACYSGAPEEIIESLLCTNPKAVDARNNNGSSPRDIVRRLGHANRKTILNLIEKVSLELLKKKRQYDNQKQVENYEHQAKNGKKSRAKNDPKTRGSSGTGKSGKERTLNLKMSEGYPSDNVELELTPEENNEGMLWV